MSSKRKQKSTARVVWLGLSVMALVILAFVVHSLSPEKYSSQVLSEANEPTSFAYGKWSCADESGGVHHESCLSEDEYLAKANSFCSSCAAGDCGVLDLELRHVCVGGESPCVYVDDGGNCAPRMEYGNNFYTGFNAADLRGMIVDQNTSVMPNVIYEHYSIYPPEGSYVLESKVHPDLDKLSRSQATLMYSDQLAQNSSTQPFVIEENQDYRYSFSVMPVKSENSDVLFSINQVDERLEVIRPLLSLSTIDSDWVWQAKQSSGEDLLADVTVQKRMNTYVDWEVLVRWTTSADGYIRIFANDEKVAEYEGQTLYEDLYGATVSVGVVADTQVSTNERLYYFDDIFAAKYLAPKPYIVASQMEGLGVGGNLADFFNVHTPDFSEATDRVGVYDIKTRGDEVFLGIAGDVPHNGNSALLAKYDGERLKPLKRLAESGLREMDWMEGKLFVHGPDPMGLIDSGVLHRVDPDTGSDDAVRYKRPSPDTVAVTYTDSEGRYEFDGIASTGYNILAKPPQGYSHTSEFYYGMMVRGVCGVHTSNNFDSWELEDDLTMVWADSNGYLDKELMIGMVQDGSSVLYKPTEVTQGIDYSGTSRIAGRVYEDLNRNDRQDAGEEPIAGIRVELQTMDPHFPCGIHNYGIDYDVSTDTYYFLSGGLDWLRAVYTSADKGDSWQGFSLLNGPTRNIADIKLFGGKLYVATNDLYVHQQGNDWEMLYKGLEYERDENGVALAKIGLGDPDIAVGYHRMFEFQNKLVVPSRKELVVVDRNSELVRFSLPEGERTPKWSVFPLVNVDDEYVFLITDSGKLYRTTNLESWDLVTQTGLDLLTIAYHPERRALLLAEKGFRADSLFEYPLNQVNAVISDPSPNPGVDPVPTPSISLAPTPVIENAGACLCDGADYNQDGAVNQQDVELFGASCYNAFYPKEGCVDHKVDWQYNMLDYMCLMNSCFTSEEESPEVTPLGEMVLQNGDFSDGSEGWYFYKEENAYFTTDEGMAAIEMIKTKVNTQLYQKGWLEGDSTYEFSFRAKTKKGTSLPVMIHNHVQPFNSYIEDNLRFPTSTSWQEYKIRVTTNSVAGDSIARLRFYVGHAPIGEEIYIDDVSLEKL